jgi:CHAT domain
VELMLTADDWPLPVVASLAAVRPEDFLVEGPDHGVIEVPRREDSAALTFTLVPQSLGPKVVRVRFEQDHQFLRMALVRTEVVAAAPGPVGEASVDASPQLHAKGLPPDITIYVDEVDPLSYDLSVRTSRDELGSAPRVVDRIEFSKPPDAYFDELFSELDRKTRDGLAPAEFDDAIRRTGSNLFDTLFHDAAELRSRGLEGFKWYYWSTLHPWSQEVAARGQSLTVQIVSSDPYIPWELLRPSRRLTDGRWEPDPQFFCQRFALSRWLATADTASWFPLRTVALVAPPSNLAWVREEVDAIERLGLQTRHISDVGELYRFLQDETADVVHFACHGRFGDQDPARSTVIIGDRRLQPRDITAEYRNFARVQPLVFLNACDSGRLGIGLTGMEGWARAFLSAGTGFFIGSVWKTTDDLACRFAAAFYSRLQAGANVGEAVRGARSDIARPGDATFLSYSLYANPRLRAARALP